MVRALIEWRLTLQCRVIDQQPLDAIFSGLCLQLIHRLNILSYIIK